MGSEAENFVRRILDELICPICLDIYTDPVAVIECEHIFCKSCITPIIQSISKKTSKDCPVCKSDIKGSHQLPYRVLSKIFRQVKERFGEEINGNFPNVAKNFVVDVIAACPKDCGFVGHMVNNGKRHDCVSFMKAKVNQDSFKTREMEDQFNDFQAKIKELNILISQKDLRLSEKEEESKVKRSTDLRSLDYLESTVRKLRFLLEEEKKSNRNKDEKICQLNQVIIHKEDEISCKIGQIQNTLFVIQQSTESRKKESFEIVSKDKLIIDLQQKLNEAFRINEAHEKRQEMFKVTIDDLNSELVKNRDELRLRKECLKECSAIISNKNNHIHSLKKNFDQKRQD